MTTPTDNTPVSTPTGDAPTPDTVTGTGIDGDTQGELFDLGKTPADKADETPAKADDEVADDGTKSEDKPDEQADATDDEAVAPTLEDMGYGDVTDAQRPIAEIAVKNGISYEELSNAVDADGKLDMSKFKDMDAMEALTLKSTVEGEVLRIRTEQTARMDEIHTIAGGKDAYDTMINWLNKEMKVNEALRAEGSEMAQLLRQGGSATTKLAVTNLMSKFKNDPNTVMPMTNKQNANVSGEGQQFGSAREELDAGWARFKKSINN